MKWNEVVIITTTEAADATANLLVEAGAQGTVIEDELDYINLQDDGFGQLKDSRDIPEFGHDVFVKAYYPDEKLFKDTLNVIRKKMSEMTAMGLTLGKYELLINDVKEEDWEHSWKQFYHPIRVTRYLTIVPFWEKYKPVQVDEKILLMDPGMAFGTGTHPTTRLSLEALETVVSGGEKVLDVGTGSGILSIASKALGAGEVFAYDIDSVAIKQTKMNVELNGYTSQIAIEKNSLLEGIHDACADIIVANILAEILLLMIEDAWNNLKNNGVFILSGIIDSKKEELLEVLVEQGFIIEEIKNSKDWYCVICKKELEGE